MVKLTSWVRPKNVPLRMRSYTSLCVTYRTMCWRFSLMPLRRFRDLIFPGGNTYWRNSTFWGMVSGHKQKTRENKKIVLNYPGFRSIRESFMMTDWHFFILLLMNAMYTGFSKRFMEWSLHLELIFITLCLGWISWSHKGSLM